MIDYMHMYYVHIMCTLCNVVLPACSQQSISEPCQLYFIFEPAECSAWPPYICLSSFTRVKASLSFKPAFEIIHNSIGIVFKCIQVYVLQC